MVIHCLPLQIDHHDLKVKRHVISILWGLPWIPGNLGFHDLQLWCVNVGLDPISPILLNSAKNRQKRIRKNLNLFLPSGLDLPPLLHGKAKVCQKNGKKLICFGYLQIKAAHYSTYHLLPDHQCCVCPICLLLFSQEGFRLDQQKLGDRWALQT